MDAVAFDDMIDRFPMPVPSNYVFVMNKTDFKNMFGIMPEDGFRYKGIEVITFFDGYIQDEHFYLMSDPRWTT